MSATRWIVEAAIMPKDGVNDPQGEVVRSGLSSLAFVGVGQVRCGKLIRIELEAPSADAARDQGRSMCARLLANPVIEQFDINVIPAE